MELVELLSIGFDCSPAAALRNLGYRNTAFPFDWVDTTPISAVLTCLEEDFKQYHTSLRCIGSRMIDAYGFQFPHDYPFSKLEYNIDSDNEWRTAEDVGGQIVDNWIDYYPEVKEKYDRRIKRFRDVGSSAKPIVVLTRRSAADACKLREALSKYYNRHDIYMVVATQEQCNSDIMVTCTPEMYGDWNNIEIWRAAIDTILQKIKLKHAQ
jgi:hypothetical protein